ncbi:27689_t:CDS:2, partial [Racocetra persica]
VNKNRQLQNFEPKAELYPDGFKGMIKNIKEWFPYIKYFGVWHSLWGYWNGVDPNSELSASYRIERVKHSNEIIHLVIPQDIHKFYNDFYNYLKDQGVDMVKVDSQGSFDLIDYGQSRHRRWWREYHDALKTNSKEYFDNRMIYCMAHTPNIIQQVLSGSDSSDDIPISRPLFRDMFQSHHRFGEYHAAARAISGGPLYISDNGRICSTKAYLGSNLLKNVKYDMDKKLLSIGLDKEDIENDGQRTEFRMLNQDMLNVELFLEIIVE